MKVPFSKDNILKAHKQNRSAQGDVDLYYHPTEKSIRVKSIDLLCKKPLTDEKVDASKIKKGSTEKWLEAYIIQLAKRSNNYQDPFELANSYYYFLYSQLNFRKVTNEKGAHPLDCLLFEPSNNHFVVLELKTEANMAVLKTAVEELNRYTKKISELKNELKDVLTGIYELGGALAVEGYLVWPKNDLGTAIENKLNGWGLIECSDNFGVICNGKFVEPWEKYRKYQQKLTIQFNKIKPSKTI